MRSSPFCDTRRALIATIGISSVGRRPDLALQRFPTLDLALRVVDRVVRREESDRVAGIPERLVDAVAIPENRSRSDTKTPSRPKPPAAVRSSCAWVGLTVVTASANTRPPFSKLYGAVPLELPPVEERRRKPEIGEGLAAESVPGSRRCAPRTRSSPGTARRTGPRAQVDRRERRVPIVRVQQHGRVTDDRRKGGERGHGEARVASRVVAVVATPAVRRCRPSEIVLALHEVDVGRRERIVGRDDDASTAARLLAAARPARRTRHRPVRRRPRCRVT